MFKKLCKRSTKLYKANISIGDKINHNDILSGNLLQICRSVVYFLLVGFIGNSFVYDNKKDNLWLTFLKVLSFKKNLWDDCVKNTRSKLARRPMDGFRN